jgi:hypothetical protein
VTEIVIRRHIFAVVLSDLIHSFVPNQRFQADAFPAVVYLPGEFLGSFRYIAAGFWYTGIAGGKKQQGSRG